MRRPRPRPRAAAVRARDGIRAGRGHVLQLAHPEPGRPPDRLYADHDGHSPARAATRADQGPGRREDVPLRVRQRRRGGRPLGRRLPAEHDPHATVPEPAGDLPRPPTHRRRAAPRGGARGSRPRCRRAGRGTRAPGVRLRRVARGGARDRRGQDSNVVGGRRADAGERGRIALRRAGSGLERVVGAALRRRLAGARRGEGGARRRVVRGRVREPRDRGGDELVASPRVPAARRARCRSAGRRPATRRCARCRIPTPIRSRS